MTTTSDAPELFRRAVSTLSSYQPRQEISVARMKAPQRLAPYAHALEAEVDGLGDELATGRLILLHDPNGHDGWDGVFRLITYLRAEVDAELTSDPMLPEVGWSWLTEALEGAAAPFVSLGGTVTETNSARFGEIEGPARTYDLQLRASWTPTDAELAPHMQAFCELMAAAVSLPPVGVAVLSQRRIG